MSTYDAPPRWSLLAEGLLGWDMARSVLALPELARERPELVARVVTLGSPVVGGPKYTAVGRMYRQRGADLDAIEAAVAERERQRPLSVPVTAIYSRRDGVVSWRACIDAQNAGVEHVEVSSTHTGLGFQAEVLAIVARRLAGPATAADRPAGSR